MTKDQNKVWIAGGSGGLGRSLAELYEKKGWTVTCINRDQCDFSKPDAVSRLLESPEWIDEEIDVFIYAAGYSEVGYIDALDENAFRRSLEVNFHTPVAMFRKLAKENVHCRRFVFIHSGVTQLSVPGLLPYSLSKRALSDYMEMIDLEKSFADCQILEVWPGPMATGFNSKTRLHGDFQLPSGPAPKSPERIARRIFQAEREGRNKLILSWTPWLLGKVQGLFPNVIQLLFRFLPSFHRRT